MSNENFQPGNCEEVQDIGAAALLVLQQAQLDASLSVTLHSDLPAER